MASAGSSPSTGSLDAGRPSWRRAGEEPRGDREAQEPEFRFRTESAETRKKIDAIIRRVDRLAGSSDGQVQDAGD